MRTVLYVTARILPVSSHQARWGQRTAIDRLRDEGFSDEVIAALDAVTKREGEDYQARSRMRCTGVHANFAADLAVCGTIGPH